MPAYRTRARAIASDMSRFGVHSSSADAEVSTPLWAITGCFGCPDLRPPPSRMIAPAITATSGSNTTTTARRALSSCSERHGVSAACEFAARRHHGEPPPATGAGCRDLRRCDCGSSGRWAVPTGESCLGTPTRRRRALWLAQRSNSSSLCAASPAFPWPSCPTVRPGAAGDERGPFGASRRSLSSKVPDWSDAPFSGVGSGAWSSTMSCSSVIALISRSASPPPPTVLRATYAAIPLTKAHRAILALCSAMRVILLLANAFSGK